MALTVEELLPLNVTGVARTNVPVSFGVPIKDAEGVNSTANLRVTGGVGNLAQFKILETWPSGNIKWLLIDVVIASIGADDSVALTLDNQGS